MNFSHSRFLQTDEPFIFFLSKVNGRPVNCEPTECCLVSWRRQRWRGRLVRAYIKRKPVTERNNKGWPTNETQYASWNAELGVFPLYCVRYAEQEFPDRYETNMITNYTTQTFICGIDVGKQMLHVKGYLLRLQSSMRFVSSSGRLDIFIIRDTTKTILHTNLRANKRYLSWTPNTVIIYNSR